ncbi:putative succinate-semialdehyde dehydrogenase [NADP(+)] 2 [bioreactor metagenome]|uniref:Putative succinate-semialdehyde dehydrogenase [NADP(+)] 2 n=1 Tax=bioreactor metagenome TaxID=1076179 RepID=A0A645BKW6_9ZZZZ
MLADADLRSAAIGAVRAAFASAGQLCIGVERIYVEQSVHRAFLERFLAVVARMRLGVGLAWDLDMGTLVSARQLERVSDLVADAVARGATVLAGGRPRPDLAPWYYEPTVLADVPDDARLTRTEAFGPVVSVQPVADLDEAVALANASDYGLSASVWTSGRRGEAVARRLEVGTVNVNEAYAAAWASHAAPMGGWKDSGMGRRHGVEGLLKFTESRTIATQRLLPLEPPPGRPGAARAFAAGMTPVIRLLDRFR